MNVFKPPIKPILPLYSDHAAHLYIVCEQTTQKTTEKILYQHLIETEQSRYENTVSMLDMAYGMWESPHVWCGYILVAVYLLLLLFLNRMLHCHQ